LSPFPPVVNGLTSFQMCRFFLLDMLLVTPKNYPRGEAVCCGMRQPYSTGSFTLIYFSLLQPNSFYRLQNLYPGRSCRRDGGKRRGCWKKERLRSRKNFCEEELYNDSV